MTDFLERMPPFLRERIHAEGWTSWRGVQEGSFRVLFDTDDHLLVSAGTSSGKTEAAMIPVVSSLAQDPPEGIGALYVGPTRALIDDQFARMGRLLRDSPVAVTGWHGDVAPGVKDRLRTDPEGILQITPESLQGIVCDPALVRRMFPQLRFVVIDEVHTFMSSDRGLQLMCELESISRIAGCDPRRIGLSATVSDAAPAEEWLAAGTSRRVSLVRSEGDTAGRVGIKHARIPADPETRGPALLSFYRELHRLTAPYTCIVFANSRVSAERTARSLRRVAEAEGDQSPVLIHHGSISARLRRDAERMLREGQHPTVVATSTLELGMDIGGLDRVVQIGAPYTCSSMLQRMGRTGRRGGRREMVVICVDDASRWSPSPPGVSAELARAVAVADLAVRRGWTESSSPDPLPFGLLYHQMMAYLKGADHDVRWPELRDAMLSMWAFRNVSREEIRELARHMLAIGHLKRMEDGTLIIGIGAESVVNGRGFPSVFEAPAETEVRCAGETVGTVQGTPAPGRTISLAGRIWRVRGGGDGWVDVEEAPGAAAENRWESLAPEVDDAVMARMREILASDEEFPWLDSAAREELESSRAAFRLGGLDGAVPLQGGFAIYPWVGTRRFEALRRELISAGYEVSFAASPLWMTVRTGGSWDEVTEAVSHLLKVAEPEDLVLMDDVIDMGKYQRFVPEGLRAREFAASRLTPWDPSGRVLERRDGANI